MGWAWKGPGGRRARSTLAAALPALLLCAGCGLLPGAKAGSAAQSGGHAASALGTASPSAQPPASALRHGACPATYRGFSCTMGTRIAAVERFLRTRPGMTGIVLRDRDSGAVWRNRYAGAQIYMASTSKLGMAVTLLIKNQAGDIHLSTSDWALLNKMLHVSSDSAADALWFQYGASFYTSFFPQIGLMGIRYLHQPGVRGPYWGEMTCTPDDLSGEINDILGKLPASDRDYLVRHLRHVGTVQHFGVWGAGPANQPGNKDGWSLEKPGWVIDSVGFAGPHARYTLTMMNSLEGQGGYRDGTDTVTQVASLLFRGHQIPAPTLRATP